MFNILTFVIASSIVSFIIAFPIISLLYKYRIVRSGEFDDTFSQIPSRKDKLGIPIMGGIIVIITVLLLTFLFNLTRSHTLLPISVMLLCAIIGALDDLLNIFGRKRPIKSLRHTIRLAMNHAKLAGRIYNFLLIPWSAYKAIFYSFGSRLGTGLHPHEKILVQFCAGAIIAYWMYFKIHWTLLWLPFGIYLNIGWLLIPLVIFLVIFMANAVNLTDGVDGLAGGLLLSSYAVFMIIAFSLHDTSMAELCATVVGALIAYLYFNVKPARFQMGDVGSLALGGMLATIAILLHREAILLIIGFIFILEILSSIIQRFFKKQFGIQVFRMAPLHHHLEMIGWSEEKIVMRLWIFSVFLIFLSLWVSML